MKSIQGRGEEREKREGEKRLIYKENSIQYRNRPELKKNTIKLVEQIKILQEWRNKFIEKKRGKKGKNREREREKKNR